LNANDTVLREGERVGNKLGGKGAENWRVDVGGVEEPDAESVEIVNNVPLMGSVPPLEFPISSNVERAAIYRLLSESFA
jgi:hypothetical protein